MGLNLSIIKRFSGSSWVYLQRKLLPSSKFQLARGIGLRSSSSRSGLVLHLGRFGRDADHHVSGRNVLGDDRSGADHGPIADLAASKNGAMIGQSNIIPDAGGQVIDLRDFVDVVRVRVDIYVVGNRNVVPNFDTSPIV